MSRRPARTQTTSPQKNCNFYLSHKKGAITELCFFLGVSRLKGIHAPLWHPAEACGRVRSAWRHHRHLVFGIQPQGSIYTLPAVTIGHLHCCPGTLTLCYCHHASTTRLAISTAAQGRQPVTLTQFLTTKKFPPSRPCGVRVRARPAGPVGGAEPVSKDGSLVRSNLLDRCSNPINKGNRSFIESTSWGEHRDAQREEMLTRRPKKRTCI